MAQAQNRMIPSSDGGVQIGSRRNSNRPSYVANDLSQLAPLQFKLAEAEANGINTQPAKRRNTLKARNTSSNQSITTVMVTTNSAMSPKADSATKSVGEPQKKKGRGRPSNAAKGLGEPAYFTRNKRRAANKNMSFDEFMQQQRAKRKAKDEKRKSVNADVILQPSFVTLQEVLADLRKSEQIQSVQATPAHADAVKAAGTKSQPVSSSKPSSIYDLLDYYAAQGNQEYEKVKDFIDKHDIVLQVAISLLSGRTSQPSTELIETFKEGTFVVRSVEHAERLLSIRDQVKDIAKGFYRQKNFTIGLAKVASDPNFDEARMAKKLVDIGYGNLHKASSSELYAKQFQDIFNKNCPQDKRISVAN